MLLIYCVYTPATICEHGCQQKSLLGKLVVWRLAQLGFAPVSERMARPLE